MSSKIQCPSCESLVPVGARLVGKKVECPTCRYRFLAAPDALRDDAPRRKPALDDEFELSLALEDQGELDLLSSEFELSLDERDFEIPSLEDSDEEQDQVISLDNEVEPEPCLPTPSIFDEDEEPRFARRRVSRPRHVASVATGRSDAGQSESGETSFWQQARAFLHDPRANVFTSLFWLFLGWAVARWTPWLGLAAPGVDELVNFIFPLVTVALVGWNLWASARLVYRSGHALSALPLTVVQILLFTLLFFQIGSHGGAEHYSWQHPPGVLDWAGFSFAHALRATDVIDGIEAYGLRIQNIRNESHLASITLILFHLVVTIFFISLFMEWVNRLKRRLLADPRRVLLARLAGVAAALLIVFCWIGSAVLSVPRWRPSDIVLWPIDNFLRVLDFADVFEIYHYRMHQLPFYAWEGSLTLACRFVMAVFIADFVGRISVLIRLRYLGGFALSEGDLVELRDTHTDFEVRRLAEARLDVVREARASRADEWRKWNSRGTWRAGLALAGAALVTPLLMPWGQLPVENLAQTAVGESPWQGARALAALRRMGSAAGKEAVLKLEQGQAALPPDRRLAVVETWGHLGEPAIEPLSRTLLSDPDSEMRLAAVSALERIGPPAAPTLVQGMKSNDPQIALACETAIEQGGYDTVQALVDHIDEGTAEDVVPLLDKLNPYWVRHLASNGNVAFPQVAKARREGLLLSGTGNAASQLRALERLAEIGPLAAAERSRVEPLLSSPDSELLMAAVSTLSRMHSAGGEMSAMEFSVLLRLAQEVNAQTRQRALDRLCQAHLDKACCAQFERHLLGLALEKDPAIVERVHQRLVKADLENGQLISGLIGSLQPLLPNLSALVTNHDPAVRLWTMRLLEKLGPAVAAADRPQFNGKGQLITPEVVGSLLPQLVQQLAILYSTGLPDEQAHAARALVAIDVEGAHVGAALSFGLGNEASLQRLLADAGGAPEQRRFAAIALGAVGKSLADVAGDNSSLSFVTSALLDIALDEDTGSRDMALQSLAKFDESGRHTALAARKRSSAKPDTALTNLLPGAELSLKGRLHLVRALGQLGRSGAAAEPKILALAGIEAAPEFQEAARLAIRQIRGEVPLESEGNAAFLAAQRAALVQQLRDPQPTVRRQAAEELAAFGNEGLSLVPTIIPLALDKNQAVREGAIFVLNRIDPSGTYSGPLLPAEGGESLDLLVSYFKVDAEHRQFVSRALGAGGNRFASALPLLVELLSEDDAELRRAVFFTLSRIDATGGTYFELLDKRFGAAAHLRVAPAFRDPDLQVRSCLVSLLRRLHGKHPAVSEFLAQAVANPDAEIRATARAALAKVSPSELTAADAESYRKLLTQAATALQANDHALAGEALADCPERFRGFEWRFLERLANSSGKQGLAAYEHNLGLTVDAKFVSSTGALVVSGQGGDVIVFDTINRNEFARFKADPTACQLAVAPTTGYIVTAGAQVNLWMPQGQHVGRWQPPKAMKVNGVVFRTDGRQVAILAGNHTRLWAPESITFNPLGEFDFDNPFRRKGPALPVEIQTESATAEIVDLAFSGDNLSIYAGLKNGSVVRWKMPGNVRPSVLGMHGEKVEAFAYAANGRWLATAGAKELKLWTLEADRARATSLTLPPGLGAIKCLAFAPASNRLIAGDANGQVAFWKPVGEIEALLTYRVSTTAIRALSFSADGNVLATAGAENRVDLLQAGFGLDPAMGLPGGFVPGGTVPEGFGPGEFGADGVLPGGGGPAKGGLPGDFPMGMPIRRPGLPPGGAAVKPALPDPGSLTDFRGRIGETFHFDIVGNPSGSVYGSDTYTDDSRLAAAAIHAGLIESGQRAVVRVTILPGLPAYEGAERNGVSSRDYGSWRGSYRIELVELLAADERAMPDPGNLSAYSEQIGKTLTFDVVGAIGGSVYGTDVYTTDSRVAAAAVHAGVLKVGERDLIEVTILPGQKSYKGSKRHGVATSSWGEYGGSYRVARGKTSEERPRRR